MNIFKYLNFFCVFYTFKKFIIASLIKIVFNLFFYTKNHIIICCSIQVKIQNTILAKYLKIINVENPTQNLEIIVITLEPPISTTALKCWKVANENWNKKNFLSIFKKQNIWSISKDFSEHICLHICWIFRATISLP